MSSGVMFVCISVCMYVCVQARTNYQDLKEMLSLQKASCDQLIQQKGVSLFFALLSNALHFEVMCVMLGEVLCCNIHMFVDLIPAVGRIS